MISWSRDPFAPAIRSLCRDQRLEVIDLQVHDLPAPLDAQTQVLAPYYQAGMVPTTYKSFYYDMTKSVDLNQWPSPVWVQRFDQFYDITQAPEDLPPLPAD